MKHFAAFIIRVYFTSRWGCPLKICHKAKDKNAVEYTQYTVMANGNAQMRYAEMTEFTQTNV